MRTFWVVVGIGVAIAVIIGLGVFFYTLGDEDVSALERLRDVVIVMLGLLFILMAMLLVVITGALVWLALTVNQKVVPLLQTLVATMIETMQRVKGTTEFVGEEVAAPIISVYANLAKARMMVKTVTGQDRKSDRKRFARLLRR